MKTTVIIRHLLTISVLALLASCASVPMAPPEQDAASKTFTAPPSNRAGVYVFRNSSFGSALKKTVFIDGIAIGETARYVFLHREIEPGKHTLSTESEFSNNDLVFEASGGNNYFFRQYIKFGVIVGGAKLETVNEEKGKKGVLACKEALGFTSVPASAKKTTPKQ